MVTATLLATLPYILYTFINVRPLLPYSTSSPPPPPPYPPTLMPASSRSLSDRSSTSRGAVAPEPPGPARNLHTHAMPYSNYDGGNDELMMITCCDKYSCTSSDIIQTL